MSEGDHFTTFDLPSGYHYIEVHPEHQNFLGFEWTYEDGSTKYFQFCVLPFGLSLACYVFTKVLCTFTKPWRGIGIEAIIFNNDWIWLNNIYIYNGYTFKPSALTTFPVFTDASDDWYKGFILKRLNKEVCSAKFKDCEKK